MSLTVWFGNWRAQRKQRQLKRRRSVGTPLFSPWAADCLEHRALLSNINVTVDSGLIKLAGDSGDHSVAASVVSGDLHLAGSSGTTFTYDGTSGSSTVDISLSSIGTIKGIQITMQGGDDTVDFDATDLGTISGNVLVNLGNGTNELTFKNSTVTGNVAIRGGSGANSIDLSSDTLGTVSIYGGDGGNTITLATITLTGATASSNHHDSFDDRHGDSGDDWDDSWSGGWGPNCGWDWSWGCPSLQQGGTLNIRTGSGNDTVSIGPVTDSGSGSSSSHGGYCGSWNRHPGWSISLGGGTNSLTVDSAQSAQSLSVLGGSGADTVNLTNSSFSGRTTVALSSGQDQVTVATSTFSGPTSLSTGSGDDQTISVDDSTFESSAKISVPGSGATVNLETKHEAGPGTTFQKSVSISLPGPSAVANFSGPSPDNTLTFDDFVRVFGGDPDATVNIDTANTTLDDAKLRLHHATRVNV